MVLGRRLLGMWCAVAVTSATLVGLPPTAAGAAVERDAEATALLSAVRRFSEVSKGFATLGALGEELPLTGVVPGGEGGLGLAGLFETAVHDRLKDIASLGDVEDEYPVPGGKLTADVRTEGTVKHLDLTLDVAKTVADKPISISSATPRLSLTTSGGVDVTLKLTAKLPFAYDTATKAVWLGKEAAVTVRATGALAAGAKPTAAFGILGMDLLADSTLAFDAAIGSALSDPDGDGRLDLDELGGGTGLFAFTRTGTAAAKLGLRAQPLAGADVAGAAATVNVSWPDLATGAPKVELTQADLDRLNRFQTLAPKDLLDGLGHLANAITAAQRARWTGQDGGTLGNVNLPFMRGSLADAVHVAEAIEKFVKDSVDPDTGQPKFTSIQSMLAALAAAKNLPGGAVIKVSGAGYDDAARKLAFTLAVDRTAGPAPEPLNPAGAASSGHGQGVTYTAKTVKHAGRTWRPGEFQGRTITAGSFTGIVDANTADTITLTGDGWLGGVPAAGTAYRVAASDPLIGQITFGDAFQDKTGIAQANATASTAQVMRGYHAEATVVLDLSDPVTGQACASRQDGQQKACPYRHTNPDGTSTVVGELPRPSDRVMLRTGRDLFGARLSVTSGVDVHASVGYLGVRITGTVTTSGAGGGYLAQVKLKEQGDVPLARLFEQLAARPGDALEPVVRAQAQARVSIGVPGMAEFFGGTLSGDVVMPDIADPATLEFRGFDRLERIKDFGFSGDNPRELFGMVLKSLGAVATYLDGVKGTGPVAEVMGKKLPLVDRSVSELVAAEDKGGGPGVVYGDGACDSGESGFLTDPSRTFTQAHVGRAVSIGSRQLVVARVCDEHTLVFTASLKPRLPDPGTPYSLRSPLKDAVDRLAAAPPDTLQALVTELNEALGGQVRVGYQQGRLELTLSYDKRATVREQVRFALGDRSLMSASGQGTADLAVDGGVQLGLALPLKKGFDPARDLLIDPSSNLWLGARAEVNGQIDATIGPLPVAVGKKDGDPLQAALDYSVNLRYGGQEQEPVSAAAFFAGVDLSLNESSNPVSCAGDPRAAETDLALCAVLPVYLAGAPVTQDGKHRFVLRLPRAAPLADMFDPTTPLPGDIPRLESPAFDFSTLPLNMGMDWNNLADGVDRYLMTLETGMRFAAQDGRLPLVGHDLQQGADFIGAKREQVRAAMAHLPKQGTGAGLKSWITTNLGPVLGDQLEPVISCTTPEGPASGAACDDVPVPQLTGLAFTIKTGQGEIDPVKGCVSGCLAVERPLNIGVPGLALRQGAGKGARASVGWTLRATVGIDRETGFYLDATEADAPKLGVGVNVTLPDEIDAKLAILDVKLANKQGNPDLFAGAFTVGLKPVGRIGLAQLGDDLLQTSLSAKAAIDWRFTVRPGSPMLPGLYGDFHLDWDLTKGGAPNPDELNIAFNDVTLEAGQFFRTVLGPVVTQVKRLTDPVRPVVDQLYAPIPVLSDLSRAAGGGDVNLMTIAEKFNTLGGDRSTEFLTKVPEVIRLLGRLPDCRGSLPIRIGGFQVAGARALATPNSPDVADSLISGTTFAADDLFAALDAGARTCEGAAKTTAEPDQGPLAHAKKAGFTFPVLENKGRSLFSLLMGKDVDLVSYDSGPLRLGFTYSQSFGPVYAPPPVMVVISGTAGVEARIRAGFDTYGIRKAIEAGKADLQILDSLYLRTTDDRGAPLPVITLYGTLEAGAAVDVLLVKAGVSGGIALTIAMSWADPNNDGRFRFGEFARVLLRNPQCLFTMDGKLKVYLKAWVEIGISIFKKRFDWTIVEVTLLDFAVKPRCEADPPKLATVSGDALVLHVGAMRQARGPDWSAPGDDAEQWTVTQLPDGFAVSALGFREEHRAAGLDRVLADGRGSKGALKLVFQGYAGADGKPYPFGKKVVAFGGSGDDVVLTGAGASVVDGGPGDDQITTGDQHGTPPAIVAGGPGDDYVTVGGAGDWVAGDAGLNPATRKVGDVEVADWNADGLPGAPADAAGDGADRIAAGLGANRLYGNGGADAIGVSSDSPLADDAPQYRAQPNLIVGGPGGDTLTGGSNDDEIHTGPRQATEPDAAGPQDTGTNLVDTGAGQDKVYGGTAVDLVAGHSRPGQSVLLVGGGGDDVLAGGHGKDEIFGGPGDDYVIAEPSAVGEVTGTSPYGPVRSVTHQPLPAGVTASAKLLVGGDGDDHVVGGDGGATVFGDRHRAEPCTETGGETGGDGDGRDLILGGAGREVVSAGGGADRVEAGGGADRVCGERGDDELHGGAGDDEVSGGSGADTGSGGDGADEVGGGPGDDTLHGGAQADTVTGEAGADTAFGGPGDDLVVGGSGKEGADDTGDTLYGDTGADVLIGDNGGEDGPFTGDTSGGGDLIHGGPDADTGFGGPGDDELHGNDGDDRLEGGAGADRADGEAGHDRLFGQAGHDRLRGQDGDDQAHGGPGVDWVEGGQGHDDLAGGSATAGADDEADVLFGGPGDDVVTGDNAEIT
ncbi:calcium-binding protein, partial [Nonomuraea sp. NN258]|uniref:calcium-binding protein n=1 Tax=Nonomuraea antri TaxID=2730852 RepID=UPI00156A362F